MARKHLSDISHRSTQISLRIHEVACCLHHHHRGVCQHHRVYLSMWSRNTDSQIERALLIECDARMGRQA